MKTINIKLPLDIVQELDDRGQLNPHYITDFIMSNIEDIGTLDKPVGKLGYYYTLKIADNLHQSIRVIAKEHKLPMNELLGRLFLTTKDNNTWLISN